VAAIKLALKVGQSRFYDYVRDFGFGSRTGVELPGETRGLLRPVNKWGASSIGSIAMGQEIAVTPLQLVSMVSTIANGGVYLPPHVLMPGQFAPSQPGGLKAMPFKPGEDLPNPLPPGAHRVISTLTAAQMRKMMEGVVLFGTGNQAQLNGYSSGGKTGTAQKIDPATHTYSRSMHIASFVGIAPVNNPVIAVAVILDTPKGEYYGTTVSAPVFAEVAQRVLEYLGVPHDIDVHAPAAGSRASVRLAEDDASDRAGDIDALYSAANDLPPDDPLRAAPTQPAASAPPSQAKAQPATTKAPPQAPAASQPSSQATGGQSPQGTEVVLPGGKQLRIPSLIGLPLRKVIEQAAAAGFEVVISGSGTAREQMPAAGTMVEPGTRIAVRCGR
jgi:cell division protein FtsI (penicillin-binding protein 3)